MQKWIYYSASHSSIGDTTQGPELHIYVQMAHLKRCWFYE